ncbi:hypothetical protein E2C01_057012 [Portunus trituberculatus]|uniref:Uncharacterized protein n=1 Tax=Portunus trituberculatus TaxID=210409 RepID=A0A5B7GRW6_PORTR|nr:hypothetical protein [Portunus trituberculatus]
MARICFYQHTRTHTRTRHLSCTLSVPNWPPHASPPSPVPSRPLQALRRPQGGQGCPTVACKPKNQQIMLNFVNCKLWLGSVFPAFHLPGAGLGASRGSDGPTCPACWGGTAGGAPPAATHAHYWPKIVLNVPLAPIQFWLPSPLLGFARPPRASLGLYKHDSNTHHDSGHLRC